MSIKVEKLSKHYGVQKAVNEISFEAKPGKILGFLGPNGAGKSTTMKMLTGYLKPTAGNAWVCGQSILEDIIQLKKHIGYLPESTPLYNDMYVKEFLAFTASVYQLNHIGQKVADVIEQVGLTQEQHKKNGELSKGYRQRVGLAQAIIHNPEVLILDEPTSGLDPNQLVDVRNLIKELGKAKTVIISTHIMQEVEAICDEVVIVNKGKIVANAIISELKAQYQNQSLEEIFRLLTN